MLKALLLLVCSSSVLFPSFAEEEVNKYIKDYSFYAIIQGAPKYDAKGIVYQLKSDPCVYVESFKKK